MRCFILSSATCRTGVVWALCLVVSGLASGQDIGRIRDRLSGPASVAAGMVRNCDLVADGEFYAFPEYSPEELRALVMEDVTIKFRVRKLYKGPERDSIDVRLTNDMLECPGEGISRFAKRERIVKERWQDMEPLFEQMRAALSAYEAGTMSEEDLMAKGEEVAHLMEEREKKDGLVDDTLRYPIISDAKTFYEEGGAIGPGRNYLICLDVLPEADGVYLLEELSDRFNISWGERREYVLSGFDDQAELEEPDSAPR